MTDINRQALAERKGFIEVILCSSSIPPSSGWDRCAGTSFAAPDHPSCHERLRLVTEQLPTGFLSP